MNFAISKLDWTDNNNLFRINLKKKNISNIIIVVRQQLTVTSNENNINILVFIAMSLYLEYAFCQLKEKN